MFPRNPGEQELHGPLFPDFLQWHTSGDPFCFPWGYQNLRLKFHQLFGTHALPELLQPHYPECAHGAASRLLSRCSVSLSVSHVQGFVVLAPRFSFQVSPSQLFPLEFPLYLALLTGLHDDSEHDSVVVDGEEVLWPCREPHLS